MEGLLAYGNANEIVLDMGKEVLTIVERTPVLAGVNGTDPFLLAHRFLARAEDMGFAGVQNFPTVGLIDGSFRLSLKETGMSFSKEVDLIAEARAVAAFTTPMCSMWSRRGRWRGAGADVVVAHMGLTTGGQIGVKG